MDMKNRGQWLGVFLWVLALTGCGQGTGVQGDGLLVNEERPVADFVALQVEDGIEARVVVEPSAARGVRVVGDENLVTRLRTEVEGGRKLRVYFPAPEVSTWFSDHTPRVEVTMPTLEAVSISGGGHADVAGMLTAPFSLDTSGGATVVMRGLATESLSLEVSGGGEVTLEGSATRVTIDLSGGSELKARWLSVRDATLHSSGGGSTWMQVSEALSVSASGGSQVRILGRPWLRSQELSGGSKLTFE